MVFSKFSVNPLQIRTDVAPAGLVTAQNNDMQEGLRKVQQFHGDDSFFPSRVGFNRSL